MTAKRVRCDDSCSECRRCGRTPDIYDTGCSFCHACPECGHRSNPAPTVDESRDEWEDMHGHC